MKTLKSLAAWIAAAALFVLAGCSVLPFSEPEGGSAAAWSAISNGAPVRVAVYVGPGARGVGMFRWMQLVDQSPELEATYVDAAAICAGALRKADLLVMPGGNSTVEAAQLGNVGQRELRAFILRGGSYIGTCAGAFLLMHEFEKKGDKAAQMRRKNLGIVPFRHLRGHWGGEGMLRVRYSKEAEALCGIKAGTRTERFNGGPVMIPSYPVPGADFKVMATFESNLHSDTARPGLPSMGGHASAVAGTFGRGRIWLFACHPEYYPKSWSSLKGAFKFLTGRDVTFSAPQRKKGQLAVGWWCKPGPGPEAAELARSLVRDADFDVVPYSDDEVLRTDLRHIDALVVPDAPDKYIVTKTLSPTNKVMAVFTSFLARGGKVVTWGEVAKMFGPDANLDAVAGAGSVPGALRALKDAPPPPPRAAPPAKAENPVRAAVYFDKGVGGCASIRWIKLLSLSPGCVFTPVDAKDVRDGVLDGKDLYIAPGGNSTTQAKTLNPTGCSNVVEFVRNGGSYFGTCAGMYLALTQSDEKHPRLGFVPYVSQKCPYRGGAELTIRFAKDAGMFGLEPKKTRVVRYHGGPVLIPSAPVPGANIRVIATYDCDGVYSFDTNSAPTMAHTPAVVAGTFDKGRVAGTSPHPESYTHTQEIIRGGLKYLTGREFNPEYPQRVRGNLSVGFHAAHIHKDGAALVDRLFREPTLDIRAVADETIAYGELEHCDVLVISHPNKESVTRYIREFAKNGGRIVAFGSEKELKTLPSDLPNVTACATADAARLALLAP